MFIFLKKIKIKNKLKLKNSHNNIFKLNLN